MRWWGGGTLDQRETNRLTLLNNAMLMRMFLLQDPVLSGNEPANWRKEQVNWREEPDNWNAEPVNWNSGPVDWPPERVSWNEKPVSLGNHDLESEQAFGQDDTLGRSSSRDYQRNSQNKDYQRTNYRNSHPVDDYHHPPRYPDYQQHGGGHYPDYGGINYPDYGIVPGVADYQSLGHGQKQR